MAVLKHTGDAVTVECVEKIIKKDMRHPLTGQSLEEKDIIYVQRGGTGYSSANEKLSGSKYRPGMAIAKEEQKSNSNKFAHFLYLMKCYNEML